MSREGTFTDSGSRCIFQSSSPKPRLRLGFGELDFKVQQVQFQPNVNEETAKYTEVCLAVIFWANTVVLGSKYSAILENTVVIWGNTNTAVFGKNTVVFMANLVVFKANRVVFGANTVEFGAKSEIWGKYIGI